MPTEAREIAPVAEVVERLREAADNIERARMSGIVENLAGWEQRAVREAAECIAHLNAERLSRERDTGVPEGWQLVPKEPTREMLKAGAWARHSQACDGGHSIVGLEAAEVCWPAMLSAAPQPPTVSTQGWQDTTGEPPRDWVIRKNGYFYRANRSGYTQEIVAAGLYTEAEAKAEARIEGITAHRASEFIADMPDIVSTLTRERDQAREALAFYANQDNWNEDGQCFAGRVPVPMWASDDHGDTFIDGHLDLGATARSVLQSEKEEKA